MQWKLTAVLALSLAWLSAPVARAEGETPECCDYNGPYIGAGLGYTFEHFGGGNAGNSGVANIRIGYRFLDFVAIEGLGESMWDFNGKSGRYNGADIDIWSGWLNAKLYPAARWTGFIQPYALVGLGWVFEDTSGGGNNRNRNDIAQRYGGGIDWFVTEHLYLTTEAAYLDPRGDVNQLNNTYVGGAINWRF
jgi:opacity protein-like surface antigen